MTDSTNEAAKGLAHIKKLESKSDWQKWNEDIRNALLFAGFNDVLKRQPTRPEQRTGESNTRYTERVEAWEDKQERALAAVRDRCGHNAKALVNASETIAQAFDAIKEQYQPSGAGGYDRLTAEFNGLNLTTSVGQFGSELRRVWDLIKEIDPLALGESFVTQHFLNGLGSDYDAFKTSFAMQHSVVATANRAAVGLAAAIEAAEDYEYKHTPNESKDTKAFANLSNGRSNKYDNRSGGQDQQKKRKPCEHCGRLHGNECWYLDDTKAPESFKRMRDLQAKLLNNRNKRIKTNDEISVMGVPVRQTTEGRHNVVLTEGLHFANHQMNLFDVFLLDSGANGHLIARNDLFVPGSYEATSGYSSTGIGGTITPIGRGTLRLHCLTKTGPRWLELPNVQYAPNAGVNLLSLGDMWPYIDSITKEGDSLLFTQGEYTFSATITPLKLMALDLFRPMHHPAYSVKDSDRLWHERMGHLAEASIEKLRHIADGMEATIPDGQSLCEDCVQGRLKERPHSGAIQPGTYPIELVHVDIAEVPLTAFDGSKYACTMLDDYSDWADVKPAKHKSELFSHLRFFIQHNETPQHRCRRIRLDRGGENSSTELKQWAYERGVELEYTDTEQHQANGKAERLIRTLMDKHQPLSQSTHELNRYWSITLPYFTVYVRNRSPTTKATTPFELWTKRRPNLRNIRTLGSTVYVLKTEKKRPKWLGSKVVKGQLLGFKGNWQYWIRLPDGTVNTRTNVVFKESLTGAAKPCDHTPVIRDAPDEIDDGSEAGEEDTKRPQSPSNLIDITQPAIDLLLPSPTTSKPGEPEADNDDQHDTPEVQTARPFRTQYAKRLPDRYQYHIQQYHFHMTLHCVMLAAIATEPYEPRTLAEAQQSYQWSKWKDACDDEVKSLRLNKTWRLKKRTAGMHVLRGKWVFKIKRGPDGSVQKYKARWVVRGFEQREGSDYNDTFATVVKPMSYKAIFAIAAAMDYHIEQMDVKTAFLYGAIDEEIYVEQPTGFEQGEPDEVCRLDKALYGLKQSPRIWYNTLTKFLKGLGFEPLSADWSVFVRRHMIVAIYVDDILISGPDMEEIQELKNSLGQRFQMTDLGACKYYLGMTVRRDRVHRRIYLGQQAYIEKFLREHDQFDVKTVATPMDKQPEPAEEGYVATDALRERYQRAVGSLMYCMLGTRPDIAFAVSVVSRYSSNPTQAHLGAVYRIFRYLRTTIDYELVFTDNLEPLHGFTDADWAGDHETRRSTSGYIFSIGSAPISWSSKRQPTVALSTCEAEYIGQTQATKEAVWLRQLLKELANFEDSEALPTTIIYGDNQGAIALAKNPTFHGRAKHIDIQHHYTREKITDGTIELSYVDTTQQLADGLTKPLPKEQFAKFRKALGLQQRATSN